MISGEVLAAGIALYPHPDVVPGVPLVLDCPQFPGGKAFNPAAFTAPPTAQQGNFGRNVLRGFGATKADDERYRGSTKGTIETRAQKAASLKFAAAIKGSDPLDWKALTLRQYANDFLR
jgi:hypothetical protein